MVQLYQIPCVASAIVQLPQRKGPLVVNVPKRGMCNRPIHSSAQPRPSSRAEPSVLSAVRGSVMTGAAQRIHLAPASYAACRPTPIRLSPYPSVAQPHFRVTSSGISVTSIGGPLISNRKSSFQRTSNPRSVVMKSISVPISDVGQEKQKQYTRWHRTWVPLAPLSSLDPSRPNPVMVLGEQLVVWRHSLRGWVVQRDVCPHRLAPLSEGRLEAAGTRLACAYHGWEFDEEGSCTKVPQLSFDPRAAATACSSPRSCVTTYPTLELDGLLLVWMDDSKEGRQQAKIAPKPKLLEDGATPLMHSWLLFDMPVDYMYWLEQGMDPSHANFLHHGAISFFKENSLPMSAKSVKDVDLAGGFMWEHGAYEKKQSDMRGFREFLPPFCTKVTYCMPNGTASLRTLFVVPVRPGVCRTVGVFASGPPPSHLQLQPQDAATDVSNTVSKTAAAAATEVVKKTDPEATSGGENNDKNTAKKSGGSFAAWLLSLIGKLPHWVLLPGIVMDQDLIIMSRQEVLMRRHGLGAFDYNLNSKADAGVAAVNVWLKQAGYPDSLWGKGPAPQSGPTFSRWPATELSLEQLLSRQDRHVRHCAVCQRGMKLVTAVCTALTAAAGIAAVAATMLTVMAAISPAGVAAVGGWGPLAGAVVAVVVLAALAVQGWSFREERFVSGAAQWRRIGGLSVLGAHPK